MAGIGGAIAIIGAGATRFGEHFDKGYFDLLAEAAHQAYADAGVGPDRIEAAWLGTCYAVYTTEGNAGSSLAEGLGLYGIPISRVANYCATGMDALRNASFAVACGECDVALVVGVEKMRDVSPRGSLLANALVNGHPFHAKGRTAPGMFALAATRYFSVYGEQRDAMAEVAVKNHYHGKLNPRSHFRMDLTRDQVLGAPMVAWPIGGYDACPTTDGAAALIITRADLAPQFKPAGDYVVVQGVGMSVATGNFSAQFDQRSDFLGFAATRQAAARAYKQAGISDPRRQIDVAECHDCFTITEILNYEDLGLADRGQGWRLVLDGETRLGGRQPVNTSGGLNSCGHPIGATGVRMVVDIVDQLLGRAVGRQVPGAHTGLAHTLGGPGAVSCVFVLGLP